MMHLEGKGQANSVEVARAPGAIHQQSVHKSGVASTAFSVDLVIVLFRVGVTCHMSHDLLYINSRHC